MLSFYLCVRISCWIMNLLVFETPQSLCSLLSQNLAYKKWPREPRELESQGELGRGWRKVSSPSGPETHPIICLSHIYYTSSCHGFQAIPTTSALSSSHPSSVSSSPGQTVVVVSVPLLVLVIAHASTALTVSGTVLSILHIQKI